MLVAAALVGLALRAEKPPAATATEPASSTATAVPTMQAITLAVAPDVRLVLVDGARVDSRPLSLEIPAGKSARVSLVGFDGRMEERVVTRDSAGETLALASRAATVSASAVSASTPTLPGGARPRQALSVSAPASAQPSTPRGPLLRSPY